MRAAFVGLLIRAGQGNRVFVSINSAQRFANKEARHAVTLKQRSRLGHARRPGRSGSGRPSMSSLLITRRWQTPHCAGCWTERMRRYFSWVGSATSEKEETASAGTCRITAPRTGMNAPLGTSRILVPNPRALSVIMRMRWG